MLLAVSAADVSLPEVPLLPLQAPDAVQLVALVDDHVSATVEPDVTLLALTFNVKTGAAFTLTMTVTDFCAVPPAPVQLSVNVPFELSAAVCSVPDTALLPAHAPEAVHPVALLADQLSVEWPPAVTDMGLAVIVRAGAG